MSADNTITSWSRPLPMPDNISKEYWRAAAEGRLVIQRCTRCATYQFYPRAACAACAGEPEWIESDGRGVVHTYTVIRQNKILSDEVPYVVAMIELPEGVRIMSNVTDCDPNDVEIGMPVEVHFVTVDEGLGIPLWRPVRSS